MYAVAFGRDGFSGDSGFYCSIFPIPHADLVFDELAAAYEATNEGKGNAEDGNTVAGFWVIDEATRKAVTELWSGVGGSDSAVYRTNEAAKRVCNSLAVRTVFAPGSEHVFSG